MKPVLNGNYIIINKDVYIPFYIYERLIKFNSESSKLVELIRYYNENIFYSIIKTKLLNYIITLFNVDCELWSNPFICLRPFCSNVDIDKHFGGIESIDSLEIRKFQSLLLVDQRPNIETNLMSNIDHAHTDEYFIKCLQKIIVKIENFHEKNISLIVVSYNKIILPVNVSKMIIINKFSIDNNIYMIFIQTRLAYRSMTPTNTKIDILRSFIRNKYVNVQVHQRKINHIIINSKKSTRGQQ